MRAAALEFLRRPDVGGSGQLIAWSQLTRGFVVDGRRIPLAIQRGIFTPRRCLAPLSILAAAARPGRPRRYADEWTSDDLIRYRYQGEDPQAPDNIGLRRALVDHLPLVYLEGRSPGRYRAEFPVHVVADDPATLSVLIDPADAVVALALPEAASLDAPTRAYRRRLVRQRLHQRAFRDRVVRAYRERCAICGLRHEELLDAAHIVADRDPAGEPLVPNGLALCKLHHAAFDGYLLGVRPDLRVELRPDILLESDGPMLRHGLQLVDRQRLTVLPWRSAERPDPDRLAHRYREFRDRIA